MADTWKIYAQARAAAAAAGLQPVIADRLARTTVAGVLLHELAHAIDCGSEDEDRVLGEGIDAARKAFQRVFVDAEQSEVVKAAAQPVEPWHHGHDVDFIRAAGILHNRTFPDIPVRFEQVVDTEAYGLSPASQYYKCLDADGDFDYSDDTPIAEILDTPPGPCVTAKWRQDVGEWFRQSARGERETAAAMAALALAPESDREQTQPRLAPRARRQDQDRPPHSGKSTINHPPARRRHNHHLV